MCKKLGKHFTKRKQSPKVWNEVNAKGSDSIFVAHAYKGQTQAPTPILHPFSTSDEYEIYYVYLNDYKYIKVFAGCVVVFTLNNKQDLFYCDAGLLSQQSRLDLRNAA